MKKLFFTIISIIAILGFARFSFGSWLEPIVDQGHLTEGNSTTTGNLYVGGTASTTAGLYTQGNTHIGGNLTVDGSATTTDFYASSGIGLNGEYINDWSDIAVSGGNIFNQWLDTTSSPTFVNGTFTGNVTTTLGLYTQGSAHIGGNLTVDEIATIYKIVVGNGYLGVGNASPFAPITLQIGAGTPNSKLYNLGFDNLWIGNSGNSAQVRFVTSHNTDSFSSNFVFLKTGGTLAIPTNVAVGESLGKSWWQGFYNADKRTAFVSEVLVESINGNNLEGYMAWSPYTAGVKTERMRLTNAGYLGIGTTTPPFRLSVNGDILADSYIEYSPIFKGDAISLIKNISAEKDSLDDNNWGDVDHNTIPDETRVEKVYMAKRPIGVERIVTPAVYDDKGGLLEEEIIEEGIIYEEYEETFVGRDIGKTIQVNQRAIQQLIEKVEILEARVNALKRAELPVGGEKIGFFKWLINKIRL